MPLDSTLSVRRLLVPTGFAPSVCETLSDVSGEGKVGRDPLQVKNMGTES